MREYTGNVDGCVARNEVADDESDMRPAEPRRIAQLDHLRALGRKLFHAIDDRDARNGAAEPAENLTDDALLVVVEARVIDDQHHERVGYTALATA